MPAVTGLLFLPVLLIAVWMLTQLPAPSAEDERLRTRREPMDGATRGRFFARSGTAFLENLPQETVDDEFVRAAAGAVRDKRSQRPHILTVYTMMAPAEPEARREFMSRADAAFEEGEFFDD